MKVTGQNFRKICAFALEFVVLIWLVGIRCGHNIMGNYRKEKTLYLFRHSAGCPGVSKCYGFYHSCFRRFCSKRADRVFLHVFIRRGYRG